MAVTFSSITSVLAPAASYDLTDLATAKVELGIGSSTTDDSWLTSAITRVSRAIMTYTKRTFSPEFLVDTFDVDRRTSTSRAASDTDLQLARYPLIAVASVVQTLPSGLTSTLVEGTDFRSNASTGTLTRLDSSSGMTAIWEALPSAVRYVAGYGAAVVEAHSVPGTGPYQVTVSQSAAFSCDQTVARANGVALTRVSATPAAGQYSVAAGVYTFNASDAGAALTFTYATKVIPDDLVDVSLRLISGRYHAKGRDPALVQRDTPGIGLERWWFGGAPGQTGPFPPDIEGALEEYCEKVAA